MKKIGVCLLALLLSTRLLAHESMALDELMSQWGMDPATAEITHEELAPGVYALFGVGGNILVSMGNQGVLMVDSQFPGMIPKIKKTIRSLGGGDIEFAINTHWHFDHADGNPLLGREGAWLVSHRNARRMMVGRHPIDLVSVIYDQPPYPPEGLPVITYDDQMQFHFNGDTVELLHFGPAHTTGDTAVFLQRANVVHMGDVFNAGYPFIDAGNGGDLDGVITFVTQVLEKLNAETKVLPGHGPVLGFADMQSYLQMLETVRNRVSGMIDSGMSLEQVLAAKPTEDFDEKYGDPGLLLNRAYKSLTR